MSSDEREDFELDDRDLLAAAGLLKRKRQSKHKQTYGIWADESDEDADARPSFAPGKRKKDYTAPVSFVSGGTKAGTKSEEKPKVENSSDSEIPSDTDHPTLDPNDEEYEKKYLGIEEKKKEPEKSKTPVKTEPEKKSGLVLGAPTKAKGGYSMSTLKGMKEKQDKSFGKFARGGFAERMMKKMGYKEGQGLGKFDQGMINPVDVKLRVKGSGLGSHGTERTKQSLIHFPTAEVIKEAEIKEKKREAKGPQWSSRTSSGKRARPKYVYKTVDQLIKTGGMAVKESDEESDEIEEKPEVKIIDMTGKEQRLITDARQLPSQKPSKKKEKDSDSSSESSSSEDEIEKVWSCKELEHNLDTLCSNSERDILKRERDKRNKEDHKYNMEFEQERNAKQIEIDSAELTKLDAALLLLEQIESTKNLSLDDIASVVALLQTDYYSQWKEFDLDIYLTRYFVLPIFEKGLQKWRPLQHPEGPIKEIRRWKDLLPDYYIHLLVQCWFPLVQRAMVAWQPREPDSMLEFAITWRSDLPAYFLWEEFKEKLILQLQAAVNMWNPYQDTKMIDSWLLPWLPILGKLKMIQMITHIRFNLKQCLRQWEASDKSALSVLRPWRSVWSPAEWDQFMLQNIYPKLEKHLRGLLITVETVKADEIDHVQLWHEMLPMTALLKLFDEAFFPKWIIVLKAWLSSTSCSLNDVARWYRAWYSVLLPEVKASSVVRDRLGSALRAMDAAAREREKFQPTGPAPYLPPPPPPPIAMDIEDPEEEAKANLRHEKSNNRPIIDSIEGLPTTFKDLIEKRAQACNLVFMPKGKQFMGKDLYTLGKLTIYVQEGVCFVSDGAGDWLPTSVTKLLDKAK